MLEGDRQYVLRDIVRHCAAWRLILTKSWRISFSQMKQLLGQPDGPT